MKPSVLFCCFYFVGWSNNHCEMFYESTFSNLQGGWLHVLLLPIHIFKGSNRTSVGSSRGRVTVVGLASSGIEQVILRINEYCDNNDLLQTIAICYNEDIINIQTDRQTDNPACSSNNYGLLRCSCNYCRTRHAHRICVYVEL